MNTKINYEGKLYIALCVKSQLYNSTLHNVLFFDSYHISRGILMHQNVDFLIECHLKQFIIHLVIYITHATPGALTKSAKTR